MFVCLFISFISIKYFSLTLNSMIVIFRMLYNDCNGIPPQRRPPDHNIHFVGIRWSVSGNCFTVSNIGKRIIRCMTIGKLWSTIAVYKLFVCNTISGYTITNAPTVHGSGDQFVFFTVFLGRFLLLQFAAKLQDAGCFGQYFLTWTHKTMPLQTHTHVQSTEHTKFIPEVSYWKIRT